MKKNILITGITKGIGKAIAKKFSQYDFHLIGCSSNSENVHHFLKEFPSADVQTVDLSQKNEVIDWGKQVSQKYSSLEILVNNAGKFIPGQIQNEEDGVLEYLLQVNLHSAYHLTRIFIPKFITQRAGTIFNICSTASIKPYLNGGSYCISKFALLGFSKLLREELKPHGVRVCSILPGATLTDSWKGTNLPKERFMQPEDIAEIMFTIYQLPASTVIEEILLRPMLGDIE